MRRLKYGVKVLLVQMDKCLHCGSQSSTLLVEKTGDKRTFCNKVCQLAHIEAGKRARVDENEDAGPIVGLNVGGTVFYTTKQTLEDASEFFERLFSKRHAQTMDDNDNFFIDRDPDMFPYILQYARSGSVQGLDSMDIVRRIHKEARFYLMQDLWEHLEEHSKPRADLIQDMSHFPYDLVFEASGYLRSTGKWSNFTFEVGVTGAATLIPASEWRSDQNWEKFQTYDLEFTAKGTYKHVSSAKITYRFKVKRENDIFTISNLKPSKERAWAPMLLTSWEAINHKATPPPLPGKTVLDYNIIIPILTEFFQTPSFNS